MANWLIDLQVSHLTLSKWIFSLSQFTFSLQTDTFARPPGPVYQHWVGMAEGSLWLWGPHDTPWSAKPWPRPKVFLLVAAMVAVRVQLPWKVWYFYRDLEQKNCFIINYVLLLIQTLCRDSLDVGQLKRKDILPLKRSPKPLHDLSQGTFLMLNAVVRSRQEYAWLLFIIWR